MFFNPGAGSDFAEYMAFRETFYPENKKSHRDNSAFDNPFFSSSEQTGIICHISAKVYDSDNPEGIEVDLHGDRNWDDFDF